MPIPSIALGLICSMLIAALFHLIVDGGGRRLLLYMMLSTAGFGGGQWISTAQHWSFLPVGALQMGPAILGSLIVLLLGQWLSNVRVEPADRDDTV